MPSNPSAVSLDGKTYEEAVQKGLIIEDIKEEIKNATIEIENESFKMFTVETLEKMSAEIADIKSLIKTFADDKAEEKASEETRKAGQELAKALSSYLAQAKKSK